MTAAREFELHELVAVLKSETPSLIQKAFCPNPDIEFLINQSVSSNTFRAFHELRTPPSVIYRKWSAANLSSDLFSSLAAKNQAYYDGFLDQLCTELTGHWETEGGKPLGFGQSRKLLNLLFKNAVRWSRIPNSDRDKLVKLLHVPLDEYSLVAIRNIAKAPEFGSVPRIPSKPSMSFIKTPEQYYQLQHLMQKLARLAGVPPIAIDVVAWNFSHANFNTQSFESVPVA